MKKGRLHDPAQIIIVLDHYVPCPNDKVAHLHDTMRRFCSDTNCTLFHLGEGIGHQLLPEKGYIAPGTIVVGADSHAGTYGALNALGTGIGSSDLAAVMATGKLWFKVPPSITIELTGRLAEQVTAKDLALDLVGRFHSSGGNYKSLEIFSNHGALILPSGCGPCCGSSAGIPGDHKNILSTANRNFLGRMGNVKASIYLGSPIAAAVAAITGKITDPRRMS